MVGNNIIRDLFAGIHDIAGGRSGCCEKAAPSPGRAGGPGPRRGLPLGIYRQRCFDVLA